MAIEIERKFLVSKHSWKKSNIIDTHNIKQGYLVKTIDKTVRVRISDKKAFLTIKTKKVNLSCGEFEYKIPLKDGKQLLDMCGNHIVEKVRHDIMYKGMLWEVDVFLGKNDGLIMAEVELTYPDQPLVIPNWLGKEVSHDKRYTNTYICAHKVPVS